MSEKPVHTLYKKYLENPKNYDQVRNLWGQIPINLQEAIDLANKTRTDYSKHKVDDEFRSALKFKMRSLGVLTKKTEINIDSFDRGIVESGQQPNCLGGPSFILNKITSTWIISQNSDGKLKPLYFIGDYDSIQPELINIRIPSPSSRGIVISYPVPNGFEDSPIRLLPNPTEDWLIKTFDKIESNYRGLIKGVNQSTQEKILLQLNHVETIIKNAFYSTDNVSDFSSKILGSIVNIESDLGVPMIFPSDSKIKPFFQDGFEFVLGEPNRSNFIKASNVAVEIIESLGYNPQIGHRKNDYVPFFFECQTPECHNSRTELFYSVEGTKSIISGACPKCKEKYSFSFNTSKPDLSDIILNITPRVDSRQAIVNNVIPVSLHIGGPGETSYFAEVAPALRVLKIPVPVFYRYIRVFYNTPWNELIASLLKENGYFSVLDDELFKGIASWVEANKKNNEKQINESLERIRKHLDDIYEKLVLNENELKTEVELIKKQLSTSKNRNELIKTLKEKEKQLQLIENYLSLAYGQYAPEKYGQEVSWLWIDFALSANVKSIASVYQRMYNLYTPNSSTYFVNL